MLLTSHELWCGNSYSCVLGLSACSLWPWWSLPQVHFQNSTLSFLSQIHIAENVLYATVGNAGWMFHWNEDPALWLTIQKPHTPHIPQAAGFVHWLISIDLNVVSSPLSIILSWNSQSHTVFPSYQSSNLPADPLEQRHTRKRENESEKGTKFYIYVFVPLDVYKTETALIKALLNFP